MNKQQLAAKIWESANEMRPKIDANEYKDYILGFIFYKYLSNHEVKYAKKNGCSDEDIEAFSEEDGETMEYIRSNIGYFISYKNLFSTWIKKGKSDEEHQILGELHKSFAKKIKYFYRKNLLLL